MIKLKITKEKTFQLLLWTIFIGSIIKETITTSRYFNYPFVQGSVFFLFILSLKYLKNIKIYTKVYSAYSMIFPMLAICIWGFFLGLISGPYSFAAILFDSLFVYTGILLILIPTQKNLQQKLIKIFYWQFIIAIILGFYSIMTSPSFVQMVSNKRLWMDSLERPALGMLALSPFFIGYVLKDRRRYLLFIAIIGFFLTTILSLRGTARALTFINIILIPLSVIAIIIRREGVYKFFKSIKKIIIPLSVVTFFLLLNSELLQKLELTSSFLATYERFTGFTEWANNDDIKIGFISQINREIETARGAEVNDFLNSLNWFEFIFGKGFGTLWYSEFWGQYWPIVHSGPFHLIFRGGLILLVIYYSILFSALKISWRNSKANAVAMGCFVYLISWFAKFISYGADESSYYLYTFWLIVGLAFSTEVDKKMNTLPTN